MLSQQPRCENDYNKAQEGRPQIVDMIKNREIALIINTVEEHKRSIHDSGSIRNSAVQGKEPYYTTIAIAKAASMGIVHITKTSFATAKKCFGRSQGRRRLPEER